MFEKLIIHLLNKYLGKYVQDLDAEKINLGILNGKILSIIKLKITSVQFR